MVDEPPRPGELFERSYRVGDATVELLAEVEIDVAHVHLRDVAIFPAGSDRATVGAGAIIHALRAELLPELRRFGFRQVRITGRGCPGRCLAVALA